MIERNLLEDYPDLLEVCRERDCSYVEAMQHIDEKRKSISLERFMS